MIYLKKLTYLCLILMVAFIGAIGNSDRVLCVENDGQVKIESANASLDCSSEVKPADLMNNEHCGLCIDLPLDSGQSSLGKKLPLKKFNSYQFSFFITKTVNLVISEQFSLFRYLVNPPSTKNTILESLKTVVLIV